MAMREFNLAANTIHVEYHFGEGQITRPSRLFNKPELNGEDIQFDEDSVIESEVYPYENKLKPFEAYVMLKEMMAAEYEARRDLSRLEANVLSILNTRSGERSEFKLIVESYDWYRNTKNKRLLQNEVVTLHLYNRVFFNFLTFYCFFLRKTRLRNLKKEKKPNRSNTLYLT